MQQANGVGFGDMLMAYGEVVVLNPPYMVCHGDMV